MEKESFLMKQRIYLKENFWRKWCREVCCRLPEENEEKKLRKAAYRYNKRTKPWRFARRFRAAVTEKRRRRRAALYILICMEAVLWTAESIGAFHGAAKPLIGISRESGTWIQTEGMGSGEKRGRIVPGNRKESGITIDLKNGKVEFWKKEQSVQRQGQEERNKRAENNKQEERRKGSEKAAE